MTYTTISDYYKAIQKELKGMYSPVPVYALFNRNFSKEPTFVTWALRGSHRPVYTGPVKSVQGIDRPIVQVNIFSQDQKIAIAMSDTLINTWHGYSGLFGGTGGFQVSKVDVALLLNTYDNTIGLQQVVFDCTLDVPT